MTPLPMLKGLREFQSLSQRALGKKSGVAHDTIGQIERGERLARHSTVQKLAAALNVAPFMLSSTFDVLVSSTEEELLQAGASEEAINILRGYSIMAGFDMEAGWQERMEAASYAGLLEDIDAAYKKLVSEPDQGRNRRDPHALEIIATTEATLLLARVSAQLLNLVTDELDANDVVRSRITPYLGDVDRLLVDAWLEGSAATKRFSDTLNSATPQLGSSSLAIEQEESEEGGEDQNVWTQ